MYCVLQGAYIYARDVVFKIIFVLLARYGCQCVSIMPEPLLTYSVPKVYGASVVHGQLIERPFRSVTSKQTLTASVCYLRGFAVYVCLTSLVRL
jgi:hypothetical protein